MRLPVCQMARKMSRLRGLELPYRRGTGETCSLRGNRAAAPLRYLSVEISGEVENRLCCGIAELDVFWAAGSSPDRSSSSGAHPASANRLSCCRQWICWRRSGGTILYVSGEESAQQIRLRGTRMAVNAPRFIHSSGNFHWKKSSSIFSG